MKQFTLLLKFQCESMWFLKLSNLKFFNFNFVVYLRSPKIKIKCEKVNKTEEQLNVEEKPIKVGLFL